MSCAPPQRPAGGAREPLLPGRATPPTPTPRTPAQRRRPSRRPRSAAPAEPFRPLVLGPRPPGGQRAAGRLPEATRHTPGDRRHRLPGVVTYRKCPPTRQGPASHSSPGETRIPFSWAFSFRCSGHQETDVQTQCRPWAEKGSECLGLKSRWQQTGILP